MHDGHVHGGGATAAEGRHPVESPLDLISGGVGGAVPLLRGLNAVAGVHELTFVDHDVEATARRVGTGLNADGDGVHGAGDVGRGEVVRDGRAAEVTVATAPRGGLAVFSRRVAFDGGNGRHEKDHHGHGDEAGRGVHSLRIVTLHIIKLVHRPYIAPQRAFQKRRGAIK